MESNLERLENRRIPRLTRKGKIRDEKKLRKPIIKVFARCKREQHAISPESEGKHNTSHALKTSLAKNCLGKKCAKLWHKI